MSTNIMNCCLFLSTMFHVTALTPTSSNNIKQTACAKQEYRDSDLVHHSSVFKFAFHFFREKIFISHIRISRENKLGRVSHCLFHTSMYVNSAGCFLWFWPLPSSCPLLPSSLLLLSNQPHYCCQKNTELEWRLHRRAVTQRKKKKTLSRSRDDGETLKIADDKVTLYLQNASWLFGNQCWLALLPLIDILWAFICLTLNKCVVSAEYVCLNL